MQQVKTDAVLEDLRLQEGGIAAAIGTITCTSNRDSLASADIIFNPSNLNPGKNNCLKSISEVCKEEALIVVNTRSRSIDSIAAYAAHPKNVIGTRTYQHMHRL